MMFQFQPHNDTCGCLSFNAQLDYKQYNHRAVFLTEWYMFDSMSSDQFRPGDCKIKLFFFNFG